MNRKAKERGILMAPRMADALIRGVKSQTRRLVVWKYGEKAVGGEPVLSVEAFLAATRPGFVAVGYAANPSGEPVAIAKCRYGVPGDLLWVKEKWRVPGDFGREKCSTSECTGPEDLEYAADFVPEHEAELEWRSSLHMYRWASRITLKLTRLRVERMGEISHEDAVAEGFKGRDEFLLYALERNRERNRKRPLTMDEFVKLWAWVLDFDVVGKRGKRGA